MSMRSLQGAPLKEMMLIGTYAASCFSHSYTQCPRMPGLRGPWEISCLQHTHTPFR